MKTSRCSKGFSLVEILVGIAIALIGMVVMFQTMQNWEGRKRTTSSGSEAQVSGSIALFNIERDIKGAGYGFGGASELGCTVEGYDANRNGGSGGSIPDFLMLPVLITQGASGAPDTVTVLYGDGNTVSAGVPFINSTATTKIANNADGLKPGDLFIAAGSDGNCGLFETKANPPGLGATISHATGGYTNYKGVVLASTRFNNGTAMGVSNGLGGMIYNMGTMPRLNIWQVTGERLSVTNAITNDASSDIAEGVVNFQAQYGLDDDAVSGGTLSWTDTSPTTPAEWRRVGGIRIALLVRSQQYEVTSVTAAPPRWGRDGINAAGIAFVMTNLDGSVGTSDPNSTDNWRRYRYRVYEVVIPLRNVAWGAP